MPSSYKSKSKSKPRSKSSNMSNSTSRSNSSPYATPFKSAMNRGTPCCTAVNNIAKRVNKTPNVVFESLHKAGLVNRQKVNGQWIYWPIASTKGTATSYKTCQADMWQNFVDWCISSGACTPKQLTNNKGSQKDFMTYCRKFFNKQFGDSGTSSTTRSRATTARKRRTTSGGSAAFSFPKSRRTAKSYSRAA